MRHPIALCRVKEIFAIRADISFKFLNFISVGSRSETVTVRTSATIVEQLDNLVFNISTAQPGQYFPAGKYGLTSRR